MPPLYPDSSETSSSSPPLSPIRPSKGAGQQSFISTATRKGSSVYRNERAKELKRLSTDELINLVLLGEYKVEKTEGRLKKYLLILQEQADAERIANEDAKHVREKMTQTILDSQQGVLKAKQDVEQYKLKLENAQREMYVSSFFFGGVGWYQSLLCFPRVDGEVLKSSSFSKMTRNRWSVLCSVLGTRRAS